jgi:hypothetical protein
MITTNDSPLNIWYLKWEILSEIQSHANPSVLHPYKNPVYFAPGSFKETSEIYIPQYNNRFLS